MYNKKWRLANPEKYRIQLIRTHQSIRKKAMYKIAGNEHPICDNCRCDDIRLIEINHKNGDGARDTRSKYHQKFLYDIITGRRKTDDLDLRCRVRNALHYIESKYGKLPFKVAYEPQ